MVHYTHRVAISSGTCLARSVECFVLLEILNGMLKVPRAEGKG